MKFSLLAILLLLIVIPVPNQSYGEIIDIPEVSYLTSDGTSEDVINAMIQNVKKIDKNSNKIADYLESREDTFEVIMLFENTNFRDAFAQIHGLSAGLTHIPVLKTDYSSDLENIFTQAPGLMIIEENAVIKPFLEYSSNQLGVREGIWNKGFTGSSKYSIAIIDSGIDETHSAFENRIIARYNAMNGNSTAPVDTIGHGTQVTGIAAGSFSDSSSITRISRGFLPLELSFRFDISIPNLVGTNQISFTLDWGDEGEDFPGSDVGVLLLRADDLNTLACDLCMVDSTSGFIESSFIIDGGDYIIGVYNQNGGFNQPYELSVEMPHNSDLPNYQSPDNHPKMAGMAFTTNIVNVKVLDNIEGGTVEDTLKGINWVIENKLVYNIVVVNLSIGSNDKIVASLDSAIAELLTEGILTVVAAGNSGQEKDGIFSPGSAPESLTVGAVNRANQVAYYSSRGDNVVNSLAMKPDLVAPGGSYSYPGNDWSTGYLEGLGLIFSADSNTMGYNLENNGLIGSQGTSLSAPHVSGIASLLIESYTEGGFWEWKKDDVIRIKQALIASTFEVNNIVGSGGEFPWGGSDPRPPLNRVNMDFVEGWGALSAKTALTSIDKNEWFGTREVKFQLKSPFGDKVSSSILHAKSGLSYTYSAEVPQGADLDLLVFDTSLSTYGELHLIASSTSISVDDETNDEQIEITLDHDAELILIARMVDSFNDEDLISLSVIDPEFIPSIDLIYPLNGTFTNNVEFKIEFQSIINKAGVYLDNIYLGEYSSGFLIQNLTEGVHNITVLEINSFTFETDNSISIFTVDITSPILTPISLPSAISSIFILDVNVSDNFALSQIAFIVDGNIINKTAVIGTSQQASIQLNPFYLSFGSHEVKVNVYDAAGNIASSQIFTLDFTHDTYLTPHHMLLLEYGTEIPIIWDAGTTVLGISYEILIDNEIYKTAQWDGSPIEFLSNQLPIGTYEIKLIITSSSRSVEIIEVLIIQDTNDPVITTSFDSGTLNSDKITLIKFEYEELLPKLLTITVNKEVIRELSNWDGDLQDLVINLSGAHNDYTSINIEIEDTSGNKGFNDLFIYWKDLEKPVFIVEPSPITFVRGHATQSLIWEWDENNLDVIELISNGVVLLSEASSINSKFEFPINELNKLTAGSFNFILSLLDENRNQAFSSVTINVESDEEITEGFLVQNPILIFGGLFVTILVSYSKRLKLKALY